MTEKINILIADDHAIFRKGLESVLVQQPMIGNVYHAGNVQEVKDAIKNNPVHIVFMDIRMPDVDGVQITRSITAEWPELKVIALSMLDDRASILNMFKVGAAGYITKNTPVSEILKAISEVTNGNKYICNELPDLLNDEIASDNGNSSDKFDVEFTKRETDILKLICQGYLNKEIADILCLSVKSIEAYKSRLYDKTGVKNSPGLVRYVFDHHVIDKF